MDLRVAHALGTIVVKLIASVGAYSAALRRTIPCTEGRLARLLEWTLNFPSSVKGAVRRTVMC